MIIRTGFISNSSSSSTIILHSELDPDTFITIGKSVIYYADLIDSLGEPLEVRTRDEIISELEESIRNYSDETSILSNWVKTRYNKYLNILKKFEPTDTFKTYQFNWSDCNGPYYNWKQEILDAYFDIYDGRYYNDH